jgi:hypothetical protein
VTPPSFMSEPPEVRSTGERAASLQSLCSKALGFVDGTTALETQLAAQVGLAR